MVSGMAYVIEMQLSKLLGANERRENVHSFKVCYGNKIMHVGCNVIWKLSPPTNQWPHTCLRDDVH